MYNSRFSALMSEDAREFLELLADDWDMDAAEALSLITAAANLSLTLERFIALARELAPALTHRKHNPANQSGGPDANTSTPEVSPPIIDNAEP